jgi:hypothetical protein
VLEAAGLKPGGGDEAAEPEGPASPPAGAAFSDADEAPIELD